DGVNKMSKSYGNYIGINEAPDDIYGKAMSVSDEMMWRYYTLLTDLTNTEVADLKSEVESGKKHPRDVKSELAKRLVADFHSQSAATQAEAEFTRRFREHQAPTEIETRHIRTDGAIKLIDLLVQTDLSPSKAEARRLISQGGVKCNGERISDIGFQINPAESSETTLQVGKLKFLKVLFR
ncbi:MAG: tyrosine--tRNA ligase, partial [Acidobacteria bacterium]|nr:tyrosine--tRNA ligase [Acidobacteriota bacterium]